MKKRTNKALLVIDMQKGSFGPDTPRFDTSGIISRINQLSSLFKTCQLPVIFIQHDGSGSGQFEKFNKDWEILDELVVQNTDITIDKFANDGFYHSNLEKTLDQLEIGELYITGCATDFCVGATIQSALSKDYRIVVVSDAHTTADRPGLTADQVIDHYNWVWQNMIPTLGFIEVKCTEHIINEMNSTNFAGENNKETKLSL